MNKLFKLAQPKCKKHKFPSFNLGGGAKLYKNFAQKLLAVSLCMAVVLLGTPVTTFATEEKVEAILSLSASDSGAAVTCTLTDKDGAALGGYFVLMRVTDGDGSPEDYLFQTDARGVVTAPGIRPPLRAVSRSVTVYSADARASAKQVSLTFTAWGLSLFDDTGAAIATPSTLSRAVGLGGELQFSAAVDPGGADAAGVTWSVSADSDSASVASIDALTGVLSVRGFGSAVVEAGFAGDPFPCAQFYLLLQDQGFLESKVDVNGQQQRLRVYDPNSVLPAGTMLTAAYVDGSHGDHNFFVQHVDPTTGVELRHFYNLTLTSGGNTLSQLDGPVELWFEAIDGIDAPDSFISRVTENADAKLSPTLYTDENGVTWIKVLTDHFSPYALTDLLSDAEKAALAPPAETPPSQTPTDETPIDGTPKHNVKTGDLATQLTVAGLGMTLVLALGIMLRLITSKRKFEE